MSDPLDSLSAQQRDVLAKFRESVTDVLTSQNHDDHWLVRWLIARDWNTSKAENMLREHMKFRVLFGADTILEDYDPPEVLKECFPCGFFGEDREGHPVWWDNFGNLDFRGLQRSSNKEEIMRYKVMHLELTEQTLRAASQKKGRYIGGVTSIIDLENLSYRRHYHWPSIELFREILQVFEANYPERTKRIIVVNAPRAFPLAYNIVKPFINESTRNKIAVLGTDYQEELQRFIAPDQIPQAYGGLRCEPDPQCTNYINPGRDVPERFYLTNLTQTCRDEMERVVVGRGSSHSVQYQVRHPGTTLCWEFVSMDHDIGFGCYHFKQGHSSQETHVVPLQRRNSHIMPESGAHTCKVSGTYVLKFDNSYSWMRAKEVYYSVQVQRPVLQQPPLDDGQPCQ